MTRVLILYYSSYGHVEALAEGIAAGAMLVSGVDATLRRVPELVPQEVAKAAGIKLDQKAEIASIDELEAYDAIIFGTPTRFGNMASQMRNFLDQTGAIWQRGGLVGKVGSVFVATGTQHGGQETTIQSFHTTLLHHGMIVVGIPYTIPEMSIMTEISGGTPYGATTISGPDGSRMPSPAELKIASFQGKHVANLAKRLNLSTPL